MARRLTILVYINADGMTQAIDHILNGSLSEYNPRVTVDSSIHGVRIPMMNKDGSLPVDVSPESNDQPMNKEGTK